MSGCPLILRREIKGERREQDKEEPGTLGVGGAQHGWAASELCTHTAPSWGGPRSREATPSSPSTEGSN